MQKVAELHETSFASRAGSENAPPLVEDHAEPSHARRFPFWSLAMQNEIVGHETVGETPSCQALFGSISRGLDQSEPFHLNAYAA